jgi:hypothetical protein
MEVPDQKEVVAAEPMASYAVATEVVQPSLYEPQLSAADIEQKRADMACSLDNPEACEACGS